MPYCDLQDSCTDARATITEKYFFTPNKSKRSPVDYRQDQIGKTEPATARMKPYFSQLHPRYRYPMRNPCPATGRPS